MKKLILALVLALSPLLLSAQEVLQGSTFTISATADGTQPFTYVWAKNGVVIPNQSAASFTVSNASADMAGTYSVTIKNAFGSASATAVLTVKTGSAPTNPKLTILQQIVAWFKDHGFKTS